MAQIALYLIIGAVIALTSSLLTVVVMSRLQMRRDLEEHQWQERREILLRWWERKADAYQVLLGELTGLRNTLQGWIDLGPQLTGQADFIPEDWLELNQPLLEKYQDYLFKIHQALRETGFLVSPDVIAELGNLVHSLELTEEEFDDALPGAAPPRPEVVQANYGLVQAALRQVQETAQRDLNLAPTGALEAHPKQIRNPWARADER